MKSYKQMDEQKKKAPKKKTPRKIQFKPPEADKDSKKKNDNFRWKSASKTSLLWIIILVGMILLAQILAFKQKPEQIITFYEYKEFLENGDIIEATILGNEFHGKLGTRVSRLVEGKQVEFQRFKLTLPYVDDSMLAEWDKYGVKYNFKEKSVDWLGYLLNMLPWALLILVWFFIMRRVQGGGTKGIFSFGKSRARVITGNESRITFNDVAGADEAKVELQEIIEFLKYPEKFQKLGGKIPKGALLLGPPGTGKTLLARAVAGEAEVPFFSISGADFVEMFVGVGASRVRDLFEQGKKNAPCIIFIDEIDAVGRSRGAGLGGGHDEREQTLNQLLVEMDGFESTDGVILLAATNRPDVLDKALLRPGRFDRQIVVDNPDVRGREGILKVHTRKIPLGRDVDLKILAKGTPGLSGADIANMVNEAALLAARKNKKNVDMEDFEEAKDKVMMGIERKSLIISEKERRSTAYHESGHALVAKLLPEADPIHKVTIIPRGRALGATHQLPIDEKHNYSRTFCQIQLKILLGGRVAEKLIFDEYTTGAGNDIERATELARKMVCEWGMSEKLGPLTFGKKDEEIFLGKEIARHRDYSEKTARCIDEEIRNIVTSAEHETEKLLKENIEALHALAKKLLEKEILDGNQINKIVNNTLKSKKRKLTAAKKGGKTHTADAEVSISKTEKELVEDPVPEKVNGDSS